MVRDKTARRGTRSCFSSCTFTEDEEDEEDAADDAPILPRSLSLPSLYMHLSHPPSLSLSWMISHPQACEGEEKDEEEEEEEDGGDP